MPMEEIEQLLTRGVEKIYPTKEALEDLLRSGKKITLYQGFDPTGTKLHIGHLIGLRKLAQWQRLGHKVIFLIGDGTGQAGDPSGKLSTREHYFSRDELRENAKDYVMQAQKIVSFEGENPVEIRYNGDWLTELKLEQILNIAQNFSLQQLIERDMFQERIKAGQSINLREFLYPLLQGYDSVAMEVDLELGGSDQTFNMLCGRTLLKNMKGKDKFVMTTPLLTDSQGRKIGKSEGNVIALDDVPSELYGKIMSLSDDVIMKGLEYLTDIPMDEIRNFEQQLSGGENPMKYKKILAFEIVKQVNSESDASSAQNNFENTFQNNQAPIQTNKISGCTIGTPILNILLSESIVSSRSEWARLVEQGGVSINGTKINDIFATFDASPMQIKVGKHRFFEIES